MILKLPLVTDSPHLHRWPTSWCAGRIARSWCRTPGRSPEQDRMKNQDKLKRNWHCIIQKKKKKKSMWTTWKDLCKQTRLPPTQLAACNNQIYCSLWATWRTGDLLNCSVAWLLPLIQTAGSGKQALLNFISFRILLHWSKKRGDL